MSDIELQEKFYTFTVIIISKPSPGYIHRYTDNQRPIIDIFKSNTPGKFKVYFHDHTFDNVLAVLRRYKDQVQKEQQKLENKIVNGIVNLLYMFSITPSACDVSFDKAQRNQQATITVSNSTVDIFNFVQRVHNEVTTFTQSSNKKYD